MKKPVQGLDLCARKVVMASMLYYGLDLSIVPDSEFDQWCRRLSKNWGRLDRIRQWQLGSPEELSSTGYHVKVTQAAANAAVDWAKPRGKVEIKRNWEWSKRYQVHFLQPTDFELKLSRKRTRL
jgi:hypothetical protein